MRAAWSPASARPSPAADHSGQGATARACPGWAARRRRLRAPAPLAPAAIEAGAVGRAAAGGQLGRRRPDEEVRHQALGKAGREKATQASRASSWRDQSPSPVGSLMPPMLRPTAPDRMMRRIRVPAIAPTTIRNTASAALSRSRRSVRMVAAPDGESRIEKKRADRLNPRPQPETVACGAGSHTSTHRTNPDAVTRHATSIDRHRRDRCDHQIEEIARDEVRSAIMSSFDILENLGLSAVHVGPASATESASATRRSKRCARDRMPAFLVLQRQPSMRPLISSPQRVQRSQRARVAFGARRRRIVGEMDQHAFAACDTPRRARHHFGVQRLSNCRFPTASVPPGS